MAGGAFPFPGEKAIAFFAFICKQLQANESKRKQSKAKQSKKSKAKQKKLYKYKYKIKKGGARGPFPF